MRRILALAIALALASPALAQAGPAPGLDVLSRVAGADLTVPDPAALDGADTLEAALRAALPDAPPTPPLPAASADPRIPEALRVPVGRLVSGLEAADALRASALPDDKGFVRDAARAALSDGDLGPFARRIDHDALLRSALLLASTLDRALAEIPPAPVATCHAEPSPPAIDLEGQIAIDPFGAPTRYTEPYALVIDLGGCDTYDAAIGGAHGLQTDAPAVLLDLGADDDTYTNPPDTFAFGGALAGVAASVDGGGDDTYRPTGYGALGAGVVGGVAIHADLQGDDDYAFAGTGGGYGAQGLGTLGVGIQIDLEGSDRHDFDFYSPALSLTRILSAQGVGLGGVGVLVDAVGDDVYETGSSGNALVVEAQGVGDLQYARGVLLDGEGNDTYLASVTCDGGEDGSGAGSVQAQGVGVQDGHGYLVDAHGHDSYTIAAEAQGGPGARAEIEGQGRGFGSLSRPGIGLLADHEGDDRYEAAAAAVADDPATTEATVRAQGTGFFFQGLGILADAGGDDDYLITSEAGKVDELGQGAATAAAAGLLVDLDGNDTYAAGPRSQGYAESEFVTGIGFVHGALGGLVDGGGRNGFTGPGQGDYTWVRGDSSIGFGVDGGEAHAVAIAFLDGLSPVGRPQPVPTIAIDTEPFVLHGDARVEGTSDGGPLEVDRVEHRLGNGRWLLSERLDGTWTSWAAPLSAEALPDGAHVVSARAWASRLDSAPERVTIEVERWIPVWDEPIEDGEGLTVSFDLMTRSGAPVASDDVRLLVDGTDAPLTRDGGRYTARIAAGPHLLEAVLPGQILGSTSI